MQDNTSTLNLFYAEPNPDRWILFDRYPRQIIRRVLRGKPSPGGHTRVFLNLCAGLDRLQIPYRINDFRYIKRHPSELACIVGKPFVLDEIPWENPILFGVATYSHPIDDPNLLRRLRIKKILVPGPWMRNMCKPYWGSAVEAWPVGIDTDTWVPEPNQHKTTDVLLYDKVNWNRETYGTELIDPIRAALKQRGHSFREIRYGCYREHEFRQALKKCRAMIFLCEHETQGIAYQQALSCGVPILAWDRKGPWQDPAYYPHKVIFSPVTSVPYWDERCGQRFADANEFESCWDMFWDAVCRHAFAPRDYILENLTLEQRALEYYKIAETVRNS